MKKLVLTALLTILPLLMSQQPEPGLIARWSFDEGYGITAEDSSGNFNDATLSNATWVRGDFGTAIKFNGNNSFASLHAPAILNGSSEMSISAWVLWEQYDKYPSIFFCGWAPGGIQICVSDKSCYFRLGRPNHQPNRPGQTWAEANASITKDYPLNKWAHLAVTFKRPTIKTYLNGKQVATRKWDENIGFNTPTAYIGKWAGPTHRGLVDEMRLYNRELTPEEVAKLADSKTHSSAEYKETASVIATKEIQRLETRHAIMSIGANGTITSLKLKQNGRELISAYAPLLTLTLEDNKNIVFNSLSLGKDGIITAKKRGTDITVRLKIESTGEYFRFTPVEIKAENALSLQFCRVITSLDKYRGIMAGMFSDDEAGLCLRSLSLKVKATRAEKPSVLSVIADTPPALTGVSAALVAAPRSELIPILKTVQANEPVPKSKQGGPWALESEDTRGSYLFADLAAKDTDKWIDFAKRGGFQYIHLHGWWKCLGHYEINDRLFPGGLEEMRQTVEKIHAAGLKASCHTLTACINPKDSWVSPVPSDDLISIATYTLAKPFAAGDTTLFINEKPKPGHELVWSYSCNGNAIKIGKEIIQYSEISHEPPYAFKKCTRGAFGTKISDHPAGEKANYLQQRYIAFYPEPDSKLADQLADAIANVYNTLKLDGIYFDGSEGMKSRYGIDTMRWKIFQKLNIPAITEASCWGHNSWWLHTRLGAWDHPAWAMRKNHDAHVTQSLRFRKGDLLQPQLGWWAPRGPEPKVRGQFTDELEYFAAKNLSIDGPMSIQGVHVSKNPWNARIDEMMTVLGWHERARLARYFTQEDLDIMQKPQSDFILRMNSQGKWRIIPMNLSKRRVFGTHNEPALWTTKSTHGEQPLKARIEALYSAQDNNKNPFVCADFSDSSSIALANSASNVKMENTIVTEDTKLSDKNLQINATNNNDTSRGAWVQISTVFPHPYLDMKDAGAFAIWVKGDGSGALMNIQFQTPYVYHGAVSDHYIELDFKGWKRFVLLFRERDAERMTDYVWPYSTSMSAHPNTRNTLDQTHISKITLFLNEIPAKGKTSVVISPVTAFPQARSIISDTTLTVNGKPVILPVSMESGDYVELNGPEDACLYSEKGHLITRFTPKCPAGYPTVKTGDNAMVFTAETESPHMPPRAEVTIFTHGEPFGTRSQNVNWARMNLEYEIPRIIHKQDGKDNTWTITRRDENGASPNDIPTLEFHIDVISAGSNALTYNNSQNNILVDSCSDEAWYKLGGRNNYAKFVFDQINKGTSNPGVTFTAEKVNSSKSSDGAINFSATSTRSKNDGWAAIGRRFQKPIDLSQASALAALVKGDIGTASFKVQLRDTKGKWHDMITKSNSNKWHIIEFPLHEAKLDMTKIDYILYYFNSIPSGKTISIVIDDVKALADSSKLVTPSLDINGTKVTFPCTLSSGETLKCRNGIWTIYSNTNEKKAEGKTIGTFPKLNPGFNKATLNFKHTDSKSFNVVAKITKVY